MCLSATSTLVEYLRSWLGACLLLVWNPILSFTRVSSSLARTYKNRVKRAGDNERTSLLHDCIYQQGESFVVQGL